MTRRPSLDTDTRLGLPELGDHVLRFLERGFEARLGAVACCQVAHGDVSCRLVVGMPSHTDGSDSDMRQPVLDFIDELRRYGLPIATIDERYTSVEAQRILKAARAAGTRGRISKEDIDSAAAVFIAERYLASE